MQLVRPGVAHARHDEEQARSADAEVMEKFGVPPDKVIEVQALVGDSIDNVPGVPGIGVKTAAELINEYGDLETLLARAGEIKQHKRRETLIDFADQARISRAGDASMTTCRSTCRSTSCACSAPDAEALTASCEAMEFTTLTRPRRRGARRRAAEAHDAVAPAAARRSRPTATAPCGAAPARADGADPSRRKTEADRRRSSRSSARRGAKRPFDRSKYETVTDAAPARRAWIDAAR